MKIKLVSSSTWHDKFLRPIYNGLIKRRYSPEMILGMNNFGDCSDCIVITSYHEDIKQIGKRKKLIFLEHAVSPIKSAYAHKTVGKADYVLVQGEVFSQWLTFCHPHVKQLKTGWHCIDRLVNKGTTRKVIIQRHNLNRNKPIILYLPTWDSPEKRKNCGTFEEAFPILESLKQENLLTLPHKSCVYANNTHLANETIIRNVDTYEYLLACDLIIGDTSSILVESTIVDKPIIQLNKWDNLDGFLNWYNQVDERGKMFKNLFSLYQLGDIVPLDKQTIKEAIHYNLLNPKKYKYLRDYYKSVCFYNLGKGLTKTLDAIEEVINEKI